jgi:hypothetical protein
MQKDGVLDLNAGFELVVKNNEVLHARVALKNEIQSVS